MLTPEDAILFWDCIHDCFVDAFHLMKNTYINIPLTGGVSLYEICVSGSVLSAIAGILGFMSDKDDAFDDSVSGNSVDDDV